MKTRIAFISLALMSQFAFASNIDDPTFGKDIVEVIENEIPCTSENSSACVVPVEDPTFSEGSVIIIDPERCTTMFDKETCFIIIEKILSRGLGEIVAQPID